MNVFKLEQRKLRKWEKALQRFESFNIPSLYDFTTMWERYKNLFSFGKDLSGRKYYQLYKIYGNKYHHIYEERLKLYVQYSHLVPLFFQRNTLSQQEYIKLGQQFQSLQTRMKAALIKAYGEAGYADLYTSHETILCNLATF